MLYRQKFNTFIRRYDDVGYITNKNDDSDRIVDATGAVFLSALSREPQTTDALCQKIAASFTGAEPALVKKEAEEFFSMLEEDGFIVSGESEAELNAKDTRFSYKTAEKETLKSDSAPIIRHAETSTHEFLESRFKENPKLMSFQIELTSCCNERCIHCYIPHKDKISDMAPDLFRDVLDQCRDMGLLNLTLSGGEPMLHKNFLEFLRKLKEYDFSLAILSNLTLLNDDILAEIKTSRISTVKVSLYSMNPETHDAITKLPGSFYKTRDSILRLIDNDIPLQISCPVMKQNKDDYKDVMNWSHEHKCKCTTDYVMMARYDHTTDNLENRLSLDEAGKLISDIIENDTAYQAELLAGDFSKCKTHICGDDIVCDVGIFSLCMGANGNVYPCAGWQDLVCGNVSETPLREIWESSPKVKYLRSLRMSDFPKCINCGDRDFCERCMIHNANENPQGNPLKLNEHYCKVAALNRKIAIDWKSKNTAS